jgi:transcription initiation factor IIE alpha subunit
MSQQDDDHTILHQDEVEAVIAETVEGSVGADNAAIANASVAHALNATFSDTEVEAALNALGGKINSILDALRNNGIVDEA